jgi:peptidoglycan/xylan/chitin deacetylase (PgdA/CDA1 family)
VAESVPAVVGTPPEIAIAIQVGGATLGAIRLAAPDGNLTAQTIRAAITGRAGLELYRAAVREALVGAPLDDPRSLRDRLAARSRVNGLVGGLPLSAPPGAAPPGWQRTVARMWAPDEGLLAVGRWMRGSLSSSAARRASLPVAARGSVERLVHREAEPLVMVGPQAGPPSRIEYLPELLVRPVESIPPSNAGDAGRGASAARQYGRHYFEHLFAIGEDPWSYTTPYEELKYAHTMSLVPAERPRRALELGCAEGHFTTRLAPAVDELLAADISEVALGRAAERCRGAPNIEFVRLDLFNDPIPGAFDLIVCSEILYYVGDRFALVRIAEKLAAALSPGGALVMAHANVQADEPGQPGFTWDVPFGAKTIGETFAAVPTLQFDSEIRTDAYRIHRFIRSHLTSERPGISRQVPCTVIEASAGSLSPDVQPGFSMAPGRRPAATGPQAALADRVPILMYHRIGPAGSPATRRYRVSCADFEEQLRYLRDAGFRSADLDEWAFHAETKIALDASCVVITFDDGYRDFGEYAWPLLKRYGFTACVFLVSDRVGGTNQWDAHYGEIVPLLDWSEIQELRAQGVRFGSHGRTHVPLTSLSPSSIAEELLASRAVLEERLGSPVTAVAFPYGDADQVVQHLAGAAGYLYGLSSRPGRARFSDSLLALPRIEIAGTDRIRDFILKLGG